MVDTFGVITEARDEPEGIHNIFLSFPQIIGNENCIFPDFDRFISSWASRVSRNT